MTTDSGSGTPKSPEVQEPHVREELDQDMITHQGEYRKAQTGPFRPEMRGRNLGATEDENVPVLPPMSGPSDLIGEDDTEGYEDGKPKKREESVDPRDELTPG